MNEVKGKEVKQCDAKNFEAVKKKLVAGGLEKEQLYLFDSLAKFFSGNADAVYEQAEVKEEFFKDSAVFGSHVRKCKPEKLDKECVKSIAYRIN